jgi:hypothetical protein
MLRIKPEEAHKDVLEVGFIGLPNKLEYYNKDYFEIIHQRSLEYQYPSKSIAKFR